MRVCERCGVVQHITTKLLRLARTIEYVSSEQGVPPSLTKGWLSMGLSHGQSPVPLFSPVSCASALQGRLLGSCALLTHHSNTQQIASCA